MSILNQVGEVNKKDLAYYMSLPYTFKLQEMSDEDGKFFFVKVSELEGCMSDGRTMDEAMESVKEAMKDWIEVAIEHGDVIPEPINVEEYSGKFVVRIPKTLHHRLAHEATLEGVSLNQYAAYKLSQ